MAHSRITQRRRLPPSTTWSQSTGMGGRNASERLVAINRNHWSQWTGLGTRSLAPADTFHFVPSMSSASRASLSALSCRAKARANIRPCSRVHHANRCPTDVLSPAQRIDGDAPSVTLSKM